MVELAHIVVKKTNVKTWTLDRTIPWIIFLGGALGLLASFALAIEHYHGLKSPTYVPVCNLNPILNCKSVGDSDQAHVFGFSNDFIGLAGYGALTTIGVTLLAGAKLKRWFWLSVNAGLLFAILFVTWLQFQTLYRIGFLCLFCMLIWAATGPTFWYTTLYNLREGNIKTPQKLQKVVTFAQTHHGDILIVWFVIIIALILKRFWYYWSTLI